MKPLVTNVLFVTIDKAEGVIRLALGEYEGGAVAYSEPNGVQVDRSADDGRIVGMKIPLTKVQVESWD